MFMLVWVIDILSNKYTCSAVVIEHRYKVQCVPRLRDKALIVYNIKQYEKINFFISGVEWDMSSMVYKSVRHRYVINFDFEIGTW